MRAIIFILGLLFVTNSNAQKFDCSSKTSEYQELLKGQKFDESFEIWKDVRKNCPKENEAVYTDGIQILQYKIDTAGADEKEKAVRELMKLYDQYYKNFPASVPHYEVEKAVVLIDSRIEAKEEIFSLLDSGFSKASQSVTNANAIYTYFNLYIEKFASGDKKITANDVLEKYSSLNGLLNKLKESTTKNSDYKTAQHGIDMLIKDIATCDNLSDYYTKNLESNKDNAEWLTSALVSLSGKCGTKPIFLTLAERLHAIKPSSLSANFIAMAFTKQRKFEEAAKFYNQAIDLQTDPLEKAQLYYTFATGVLASDFAKSKEYINKALATDPKMGKAYLYLGQLYANNAKSCGSTDFERKAVMNLAIQTVLKATTAEPKLKPTADKMAADYTKNALTPSEISKAKMNGKSLTIGCWINETITFPNK
ncbi:MAG: hypothetical protein QM710_06600 [Flavobacterium sp.]